MNVLLYGVLRVGSVLAVMLPAGAMYRFAELVGSLAYLLGAGPRNALTWNLSVALGEPPDSRRVRRTARLVFQCDAKNWVDTMRIGRIDPDELERQMDVEGMDKLVQAYAEGRGVILVGMHLGNFDLVGQVLAFRGYRLTVPVEHMKPERLFNFIMRLRTSRGIQAVPLNLAPREMLRALRSGEMVGIVADRHIAGRAMQVEFFDRPAMLPVAAATLARHSEAPLFVGVAVRTNENRFRGHVVPVLNADSYREHKWTDGDVMRRLTLVMEDMVRRHPDQWLVFSPVWPQAVSRESVVTMVQSTTDSEAMTGANR